MSDRTPAGAESVRVRCERCGVEYHPAWEDCKCNPDAVWGECFGCGREIDLNACDRLGSWTLHGHPLCEACWERMQGDTDADTDADTDTDSDSDSDSDTDAEEVRTSCWNRMQEEYDG